VQETSPYDGDSMNEFIELLTALQLITI